MQTKLQHLKNRLTKTKHAFIVEATMYTSVIHQAAVLAHDQKSAIKQAQQNYLKDFQVMPRSLKWSAKACEYSE